MPAKSDLLIFLKGFFKLSNVLGNQLPTTLPPSLIPPSYRSAQTSQPIASGQLGLITPLTHMEQNSKVRKEIIDITVLTL